MKTNNFGNTLTTTSTQSRELYNSIESIFDNYIPPDLYSTIGLTVDQIGDLLKTIYSSVMGDLTALAKRDPAAISETYVSKTYKGFRAVMYYRIANAIYNFQELTREFRATLANKIQENGKVETGVEIHPAATIGPRFVVDHGIGTVIGETSEIGSDCYILQKVVLGATGIADNVTGKRHPTLGKRVQVGGFARILGPIKIDNDVFIGPHCVILENIPSNCSVNVVNQLQITKLKRSKEERLEIYGIVPKSKGIFVFGRGFPRRTKVSFVEGLQSERDKIVFKAINGLKAKVESVTRDVLKVKLFMDKNAPPGKKALIDKLDKDTNIKVLIRYDDDYTMISPSPGLRRAIENL